MRREYCHIRRGLFLVVLVGIKEKTSSQVQLLPAASINYLHHEGREKVRY